MNTLFHTEFLDQDIKSSIENANDGGGSAMKIMSVLVFTIREVALLPYHGSVTHRQVMNQ